jgi:glycosyltransferase involved in cell wall biosynthesis
MICNCPVVTGCRGSLSEVAGDAAVYFDPFNQAQMSEAINHVLQHADLRRKLVAKGIIQLQKFSWDKTADQTLSVYSQVF